MEVNYKRVLGGGCVAGVLLIVVNLIAQAFLGGLLQQDMNAWVPGLAERIRVTTLAVGAGVALKVLIGILVVWLYAVIRPRFGAGFRAASRSASFVWVLGAIFFSDYLMIGMMSAATYVVLEVVQWTGLLIAAWVGAIVYEPKSAGSGSPRG